MRILYHYTLCPFSRKIRLSLAEKKLDFQNQIENYWQTRPEFLKMNAAGTVPVLVDLNGTIVSDDNAIQEYLEEAYSDNALIPGDLNARTETRRLIGWFDKKFHQEVTNPIIFEKVLKRFHPKFQKESPNSQAIRTAKHNINFHLTYINWLVERRNWLAGDTFSLADITAAAHFSILDYFDDIDWAPAPLAKEWYLRIKSRPTFRQFFDDRVPGITPPAHYTELDY